MDLTHHAHYTLHRGRLPLLISVPHHGVELPDEVAAELLPAARSSADSDHHVGELYAGLRASGASMIVPRWSRYVIDLNRGPDARPLYPGQQETTLVPLQSFAGADLYPPGRAPDAVEVQRRLDIYWRPYHHALLDELLRLRHRYGAVLLWDGHSIRSECPMFFAGRLPDFNLGTAAGRSCSPALAGAVQAMLDSQTRYSHVLDGRFKGGYITRHYGRPEVGVHALQLELAQASYLDEDAPRHFDAHRASPCRALVEQVVLAAMAALPGR